MTTTTPTPGSQARIPEGSGPRVAPRTPPDWRDEPYTHFGVRPLAPTIGAEITGLSLAQPLDDATFADLHRALLEWKVVFVRDAGLTPDLHEQLGLRWGPLETHPFFEHINPHQTADRPQVARFEKGPDSTGYENLWHSDVSWRVEPSLGSLLHAIEVPETGGDTLWADMAAAYDGLDDAVKVRLHGLTAVHDWFDNFGRAMTPEQRDALRPSFPAVEHPVVRTHPETRRRTLYVNGAFTDHIVGLDAEESAVLLDFLYRQASYPEYQCRWKWSVGDLAIWDNRATQHYAVSDYWPQRRVMERITVAGDRPFA